ncbi:MAG: response regulator [Deltaproteobacteria bacterium]|nr:response regulator [Deltaproteobacteria bacterium]MBW2238547.1 response regulator [Deltaproteobacteria bacterium]MBW2572197.1 response regulator [Deltaproteobacteria bacterium]MBW2678903.1 response regulator [Deltaproteobacteria bacterium]
MKPIVLLVDDEAPFVETMTKRLSKRDLKIITAFSGEEALEILSKNRNTDVVILDVKMPGMNGIDSTLPIQECPRFTCKSFLTFRTTTQYIT